MDRGSGYQQRWFDTPETLNEKETCSKSFFHLILVGFKLFIGNKTSFDPNCYLNEVK